LGMRTYTKYPYRTEFPDSSESGRNAQTIEDALQCARWVLHAVWRETNERGQEGAPVYEAETAIITNRNTGYRWILRRRDSRVEFQTAEMVDRNGGHGRRFFRSSARGGLVRLRLGQAPQRDSHVVRPGENSAGRLRLLRPIAGEVSAEGLCRGECCHRAAPERPCPVDRRLRYWPNRDRGSVRVGDHRADRPSIRSPPRRRGPQLGATWSRAPSRTAHLPGAR